MHQSASIGGFMGFVESLFSNKRQRDQAALRDGDLVVLLPGNQSK